ncbi:MAG: hypothetical protein IH897_05220, partial [Planctomycetes bacterium]|nr:hypothetical protein [Planctomycetota bacterium]
LYEESQIDHGQRKELQVKREGDQVVFTFGLRVGGAAGPTANPPPIHTIRRKAPGKVLFELDGEALAREGQLRVGGKLTAYVLAITERGIAEVEARVLGRRRVERAGKVHEAFLVDVQNAGAAAASASWHLMVDPRGELLEMHLSPNLVRYRVSARLAQEPGISTWTPSLQIQRQTPDATTRRSYPRAHVQMRRLAYPGDRVGRAGHGRR